MVVTQKGSSPLLKICVVYCPGQSPLRALGANGKKKKKKKEKEKKKKKRKEKGKKKEVRGYCCNFLFFVLFCFILQKGEEKGQGCSCLVNNSGL